jgi:hypothetical protein
MYVTIRLADKENEEEEFTVNNAVHVMQALEPTKVLLDNQADISIMHLMLLQDVQKAQRRIRVKGVGGPQLIVNEEGVLDGFFPVHASKKTKANVLSFADVEDLYDIMYIHMRAFVMHMGDRDIVFNRKQKLYVADWGTLGMVAATLQENEQLYTKEEVSRAKLAYEFVRNSGYPSLGEAVHLITDGNVRNLPKLIPGDVERAYKIYGTHLEYLQGQIVKKTVARMLVDHTLRYVDKDLKLYMDVMHLDKEMFLVSAVEPLNLTLQCKAERESRQELGLGLQGQLAILRSRDFKPTIVYVDPQSSFWTMTHDFPGVEIDVGGKGNFVAKVDAKIRRIKETYRKVKHGLPWKLPQVLVKDLVGYSVSCLNVRRTQASSQNFCPRVLFTGMPVLYKEFSAAFGDYVEAYEGTDNTSGARSAACIAVCPVGNSDECISTRIQRRNVASGNTGNSGATISRRRKRGRKPGRKPRGDPRNNGRSSRNGRRSRYNRRRKKWARG